jgi:hypothetical protein
LSTAKDNPSTSLLLSLLRLLLSRLKNLPHIALARNPLLHFNIKLAKLLLLRVGFFEKRFFALLQRLSLIFELLSRCMLILDPRNGQIVFVAVGVLRVRGEEFFGCREWEGVEDVAGCGVLVLPSKLYLVLEIDFKHLLIVFTPSNLTPQMPLLIIQVLQLQMQRVDLLPRFAGFLLGAAHAEDGFAI